MQNPENEDGFSIESALNKEGDMLPFGLYDPLREGKLTWICGEAPNDQGRTEITSVFCMDIGEGKTEKQVAILENIEQARWARDELLVNGWQKLKAPKMAFTITGKDGVKRAPTRKQRRHLERMLNDD